MVSDKDKRRVAAMLRTTGRWWYPSDLCYVMDLDYEAAEAILAALEKEGRIERGGNRVERGAMTKPKLQACEADGVTEE